MRRATAYVTPGQSPGITASRALRRAFSLVEMVVVIGIIVLLVGLTVAVVSSLTRGSENRRAQDELKLLDAALNEWQLTAERSITLGMDNTPTAGMVYDLQADYPGDPLGSAERQTSILVTRMFNTQVCKDILAKIDSKLLIVGPDPANAAQTIVRIRDPWDKDIVIVHPGRKWLPVDGAALGPDKDGTIHTTPTLFGVPMDMSESRIGACVNSRICFISAGPDGKFGHLESGATQAQIDQTKDNLYSYPLEAP